MKTLKILLFSLITLVYSNNAWTSPLCQESALGNAPCNNTLLKSGEVIPSALSSIDTYLWIEGEIKTHQEIYRQKKDLYADMFRYLDGREMNNKKLEPQIKKEWEGTEEDFQTLYQLSINIRAVQARLQYCYTSNGGCGPVRRMELEDQLAMVQRSKALLLAKRPILSHSGIEEYIKKRVQDFKNDDIPVPANDVKNLVKNASRETAQTLLDKVYSYERYLNDRNAPLTHKNNGAYAKKYLENLTSNHPQIVDDLLDRFEMIPPPADKQGMLCSLSQKREKERKRDAMVKAGVETSLFIAPFLLGPWGRAGVFGLEGALGAKLLRWGLTAKEIEQAAWLSRAAVGLSTNALQTAEVMKLGETCKNLEQKYFVSADTSKFQALSDCKTEYQDSMFIASMGWAMAVAPEIPGPVLKFYKAKFTPQLTSTTTASSQIGANLKSTPLAKNQWAKEFTTKDQGTFTYMDLSKIERVSDQHMKSLPDDYWKFVGDIYSERLNLTPDEIKGFIKSSQDFAPRTKLIVNTPGSVKDTQNFKGGVGVVISGKSDDLLPLEKAIGKKLERNPGEKSAEIVRLTVSKDADAEKLSKSLINQAAGLVLQDPAIKTVYIYTSKIHRRLYGKLGVTPTNISAVSDRDVLITLKREDIEKLLSNTMN
nr:hypothetical protein BHI3_29590 [Bacteriovorax sp. HI3]